MIAPANSNSGTLNNFKNSMTRTDLIEGVFHALEISRAEAEGIVDAICSGIVRSLRAGEKVEIRGFGSFRIRERRSRLRRNPKTGAAVSVPARKVPYFTPAKELKNALNKTPNLSGCRQAVL
jgi:integration host factor subunit beta